jgi:hypothetical protein
MPASSVARLPGTEHATVEDYATSTERPPWRQTENRDSEIQGGIDITGEGPNAEVTLHLAPAEPDQTRPINVDALKRGRPVTVVFDYEKNEQRASPGGPGSCGSRAGESWRATLTFDPRGAAPPATTGPDDGA